MGVIVFFSSLSFYHGLDMFLATRDALVINGSYPGFFTSSLEIGHPKRKLVFQPIIFRGELLVSVRFFSFCPKPIQYQIWDTILDGYIVVL